jgi:hypothetical protein
MCQSGLCEGTDVFTSKVTLPGAAVCTQTCCNSTQCSGTASLCYPSVGGNYCIDPSWIGILAVGAGVGGASCSNGSECNSGVCTKSRCQDVCCTDQDCNDGTVCQFATLDDQYTLACGTPPSGGVGQGKGCLVKQCDSLACVLPGAYCLGGCCSDMDCHAMSSTGASTHCVWNDLPVSGDGGQVELRACAAVDNEAGGGGVGYLGMCTGNSECASGVCNTAQHKCTKACCFNMDCGGSWVCGPESFTLGVGTLDLQVCIPPT